MKLPALCVAVLAGCAARTTPAADPRVAELEARLELLEATRPAQRADRPNEEAPRRRRPAPTAPADPQLGNQVAELHQRIATLEASVGELWGHIEQQRFGNPREMDPRYAAKPGSARVQLKPDVVYSVPVAGNPVLGDANAKVTWVIGGELTEPYTRRLLDTVKTLRAQYGADLRVVWKHFTVHDYATASAMYLCAAHEQGKFEQAFDAIAAIPVSSDRSPFRAGPLARTLFFLDAKQRDASLAGSCKRQVREDHLFAQRMHQGGTPFSFVNGRYLGGAQPPEAFAKLIDEELGKANAVLGTNPGRGYYETIVRSGQKQP